MQTDEMPALNAVLDTLGEVAVAVSGGVDSMTLATAAHRRLGEGAVMFHAVSPAVPPEATRRVSRQGDRQGWVLRVIGSGEFDDPDYLRNPANRCFHCKRNLYARMARETRRTIVSGTNLDDLSDIRPGLEAARERKVRHPFVEAGMDKESVRKLARELGLGTIARLPAAPCLASRVETGIPVDPADLAFVHTIETRIRKRMQPDTVRCRVRHTGIVVELDTGSLARLPDSLRQEVRALARGRGDVTFEAYVRGSAFLRSVP